MPPSYLMTSVSSLIFTLFGYLVSRDRFRPLIMHGLLKHKAGLVLTVIFLIFFESEIILLEPGGKAQSRCSYYIVNKG
jgi:hypothetical protein